ncbi:unnamed protein product, partial [Laminaria digitata]
ATLKGGEEGDREVAVRAAEVLRRAKVSCRVAEGTCLRLGGRVAEATEALRDLLFEDPKSVPAWVARGEAFLSMGNTLLAGLHFDRALEIDGSCADALSLKDIIRPTLAAPASRETSGRDMSASPVPPPPSPPPPP